MQHVLKGLSRTACLCILTFSFAFPAISRLQQTGGWQDGTPRFNFVSDSTSVRVGDVALLDFRTDSSSQRSGFRLFLDGMDRRFTNTVGRPEDFNPLPDRNNVYLITDAFGRRVFAIRESDGGEVAEFSGAPNTTEAMERPVSARAYLDAGGARKVIVTDQASNRVLIFDYDLQTADQVYPPAVGAFEPLLEPSAAVPIGTGAEFLVADTRNNRILRITSATSIASWNFGAGELNSPVDVEWDGTGVLITDRDNHRVIIVDPATDQVTWQFGTTGTAGSGDNALDTPVDAQYLDDGSVLIADAGNNRLIQINRAGNIVWRFLGTLTGLRSVHRLASGKTLAVQSGNLLRLGYADQTIESELMVLARPVDFDSLRWQTETPAGTGVTFQLRTANSSSELADAPWLGPDSLTAVYSSANRNTNPRNDGKQIYQFRALLTTTDPLLPPIVDQFTVFYHFFDPNTDGVLTSDVITDSLGRTIIAWEELEFNTIPAADPAQRDDIQLEVRILDAANNEIIASFQANNTSRENLRTLRDIARLQTVQAIRLQAIFETNNASISPVLDSWRLRWQTTAAAQSEIRFTDAAGATARNLRTVPVEIATQGNTARAFISLRDQNLLSLLDQIDVTLQSAVTGDMETATLTRQPTGEYGTAAGIPVVIEPDAAGVQAGNSRIEATDRDTITVRYQDPTAASDSASANLLVLLLTSGTVSLENRIGEIPAGTEVTFRDTLFVRVRGELDRNFSPAQDTIVARLINNTTSDEENVVLLELPDTPGGSVWSTGEFVSVTGIPLDNRSVGFRDDGKLQSRPGNEIAARYVDNDVVTVLYTVERDTSGGIVVPLTGEGAFDFLFAPNPYRADTPQMFRLRMEAYTGDVSLERIEIFNLAGERIRTINPTTINMDRGIFIRSGTRSTSRNPWWDLRTEEGSMASSGTYWAKFFLRFQDATGSEETLSAIRKFILIQ